jgi:phosphinothricin acetyltransferase
VTVAVEAMAPAHWNAVRRIYADGIATGNATFETAVPEWDAWDRSHLEGCRLVAVEDGTVLGWAALSGVSDRCVYGGVAEVSVYIGEVARGRGVGRVLLERLVKESEAAGFWTLQAGMFRENAASIALHAACGFREVGVRERLGRLHDTWRDVVLMERRSDVVGS